MFMPSKLGSISNCVVSKAGAGLSMGIPVEVGSFSTGIPVEVGSFSMGMPVEVG